MKREPRIWPWVVLLVLALILFVVIRIADANADVFRAGIVDPNPVPAADSAALGSSVQRYDVVWHGESSFGGTLTMASDSEQLVDVYGAKGLVPVEQNERDAYCSFVSSILERYPTISYLEVWNEPDSLDWYGALLRDCSPLIHAAGARVVGPGQHPWEPTGAYARQIAAAGFALLDIYDFHGYGSGELDTKVDAIRAAFGYRIPVWMTEDGMDTKPPPQFAALYSGEPWSPSWDWNSEDSQAAAVSVYMSAAYCAGVDAWFNFLLRDEVDLQRWQSGLERPDGSHKPAYDAFAQTRAAIADGSVSCLSSGGVHPPLVLRQYEGSERVGQTRQARGQGWVPVNEVVP